MKFKVVKGSSLFDQLSAACLQMDKCNAAARSLTAEVGGKTFYKLGSNAAGGITGIVFDEKPEGWRLAFPGQVYNAYYPKAINKNKKILARLRMLPVVTRTFLNDLVGFKRQFAGLSHLTGVGAHFGADYHLIEVSEEAQYSPIEGMEEITVSEFKSLWEGLKTGLTAQAETLAL